MLREEASPDAASRCALQVCKLLVNLHNLVNVVVKPPEKALTVSILASFFRAVFAFRGLTWFKGPVLLVCWG